jgi:branched-chain amino acid transport system permease protein
LEFLVINSLNGLAFGSILFLVGSGFTLVLGILGSLQLAHGAVYMIGAYVGWTVAVSLGLNWGIALLAATAAGGLTGLIIHQSSIRFLYKLIDEQVLATFGFIYILTNLALWIWTGMPRTPFTAPIFASSFPIMGFTYPYARGILIIVGLVGSAVLWALVAKTKYGAMVRAGMDDKETATALGINVGVVSAVVFVFGSSIAGLAGIFGAQILGATTQLPIEILRFALAVTVVGGIGSIPGAIVGAMIIGFVDAFGRALVPGLAMYLIFFVMVVMLLIRPSGVLGTGRRAVA